MNYTIVYVAADGKETEEDTNTTDNVEAYNMFWSQYAVHRGTWGLSRMRLERFGGHQVVSDVAV